MPWGLLQYGGVYDAFRDGECDQQTRDKLDEKMAALLLYGNRVASGLSEPLGDGLFELRFRAPTGKQHVRILYGFLPGQRVLVVDARFKDQRKLPKGVIAEAKKKLAQIVAAERKSNGETRH